MISGNETITLLLGIGVLIFLVDNRNRLRQLPAYQSFIIAFVLLAAGWTLTVLEGLFLGDLLNLLEHICYAISSAYLFWWCWQVFIRRRGWC